MLLSDKWFLHKLMDIADTQHEMERIGSLFGLKKDQMLRAKQQGFSDTQIALAVGSTEDQVRARRKNMGVKPFVKKIDTLAAEFPAEVSGRKKLLSRVHKRATLTPFIRPIISTRLIMLLATM